MSLEELKQKNEAVIESIVKTVIPSTFYKEIPFFINYIEKGKGATLEQTGPPKLGWETFSYEFSIDSKATGSLEFNNRMAHALKTMSIGVNTYIEKEGGLFKGVLTLIPKENREGLATQAGLVTCICSPYDGVTYAFRCYKEGTLDYYEVSIDIALI